MIARHEATVEKMDIWAQLSAPLPTGVIAWRQDGRAIQRDGKYFARFVAYVDANTVRERLDSVVAGEWDLTLELLPSLASDEQDEATMRRAIVLGNYWLRQVTGLSTGLWEGVGVDVERCQKVLQWVAKGGVSRRRISFREVYRSLRWSKEDADEVLSDLCQLGYCVVSPGERKASTGRLPSPDLVFHPLVVEGRWGSVESSLLSNSVDTSSSTTTTTTTAIEGVTFRQNEVGQNDEGLPDEGEPWSLI